MAWVNGNGLRISIGWSISNTVPEAQNAQAKQAGHLTAARVTISWQGSIFHLFFILLELSSIKSLRLYHNLQVP